MSARVLPLEDADGAKEVLTELLDGIVAGRIRAFALVVAEGEGGLEPVWGASRRLGPHAGTVLRGMVAYLAAAMDVAALEQ